MRFHWLASLVILLFGCWTSAVTAAEEGEAGPMETWAQRYELRLGVLGHDTGFLADAAPRHDKIGYHAEVLFPSPDFLDVLFWPRPRIGVNYAPGGISFIQAGFNWDIPVYGNWFATAGVGGSLNNADRLVESDLRAGESKQTHRLVGCHTLFHLVLGFGYRFTDDVMVQFYAEHISNANLCDNNEGLDQWGLRLGYGF